MRKGLGKSGLKHRIAFYLIEAIRIIIVLGLVGGALTLTIALMIWYHA